MAYREVLRLEIVEVVRRWQAGNSQRNIASGTGLSRDTVRRYLAAAKVAGVVQEGPAPTKEQLSRLAGVSRSGPRQPEAPTEELLAPGRTRSTGGQRQAAAAHPHSGVAGSPRMSGGLLVLSRLLRQRLARTRTYSLPSSRCRRWDISHEQLLWTFMLANYAKWYSFVPPQWPNFPPPLTQPGVV